MSLTGATTHTSPDYALFDAINSVAGHHHTLDVLMIAAAKYSPIVFAAVLVALWLTWKYSNQRCALLAGVSALVALGLGQVVGMLLPRDRPYLVHHVTLLVPHAPDTSFPSDHVTLAFAVAVMIWQVNRRLSAWLLFLGIVVGFARVFIGVHYPTDIVGGAVLGSAVSRFIAALSRRPTTDALMHRVFAILARWHIAATPRDSHLSD